MLAPGLLPLRRGGVGIDPAALGVAFHVAALRAAVLMVLRLAHSARAAHAGSA